MNIPSSMLGKSWTSFNLYKVNGDAHYLMLGFIMKIKKCIYNSFESYHIRALKTSHEPQNSLRKYNVFCLQTTFTKINNCYFKFQDTKFILFSWLQNLIWFTNWFLFPVFRSKALVSRCVGKLILFEARFNPNIVIT